MIRAGNRGRLGTFGGTTKFFQKKRRAAIRLTSHDSLECYIKLRNGKQAARRGRPNHNQQERTMKMTVSAMRMMLALSSDNLGFVIVWGIAMGVILKLAWA